MSERIENILAQCGVADTTLSGAEKGSLDRQGHLVLAGATDADWLKRLRAAFEASVEQPAANGKQSGTRHTGELSLKDPAFAATYTHPGLLAAIHHVLRRGFQLNQMAGRDPLPGYGQQGLHTDWMQRGAQDPFYVVTALWMLDDFTETNGATRVIPGSHLWLKPLPKPMQQPESHHPEERNVVARAGSVLIFNGHLWHSGTRNQSKLPRRALQMVFWARELARPVEPAQNLPAWLTSAAQYILGV